MSDLPSIHDLSISTLEGGELPLRTLAGRRILIVNVASECGYTPQYSQLQELHTYAGDRVAVIGVPCNDFGGQEPGGARDIQAFCTNRFGVTFPLTEKVKILRAPRHPLYDWLCRADLNGVSHAEVPWNFTKFVLSEEGHWVGCFPPSATPLDETLLHALKI
jgi:glutathione peroxidase